MATMHRTTDLFKESFAFLRTQKILLLSWLLFVFPPTAVILMLQTFDRIVIGERTISLTQGMVFLFLACICALYAMFGTLMILVCGQRLIGKKSGRARSSIAAVVAETRTLFFPYLLTSLLRWSSMIFRALFAFLIGAATFGALHLLPPGNALASSAAGILAISIAAFCFGLIPMALYALRTSLFSIALVEEHCFFGACLQSSIDKMRGNLGGFFLRLFLIGLLVSAPVQLMMAALSALTADTLRIQLLLALLSGLLTSGASVLTLLCIILLYGDLRAPKEQRGRYKKDKTE